MKQTKSVKHAFQTKLTIIPCPPLETAKYNIDTAVHAALLILLAALLLQKKHGGTTWWWLIGWLGDLSGWSVVKAAVVVVLLQIGYTARALCANEKSEVRFWSRTRMSVSNITTNNGGAFDIIHSSFIPHLVLASFWHHHHRRATALLLLSRRAFEHHYYAVTAW